MLKVTCPDLLLSTPFTETIDTYFNEDIARKFIDDVKKTFETNNPHYKAKHVELNIKKAEGGWMQHYLNEIYLRLENGNKQHLMSFYVWGYPSCCGLMGVSGLCPSNYYVGENEDSPFFIFIRYLASFEAKYLFGVNHMQIILSQENGTLVRAAFEKPKDVESRYEFVNNRTNHVITCNLVKTCM